MNDNNETIVIKTIQGYTNRALDTVNILSRGDLSLDRVAVEKRKLRDYIVSIKSLTMGFESPDIKEALSHVVTCTTSEVVENFLKSKIDISEVDMVEIGKVNSNELANSITNTLTHYNCNKAVIKIIEDNPSIMQLDSNFNNNALENVESLQKQLCILLASSGYKNQETRQNLKQMLIDLANKL